MYEQRKEWDSYVFEPLDLDQGKIRKSLEGVFQSKEAKKALEDLRDSIEDFSDDLHTPCLH